MMNDLALREVGQSVFDKRQVSGRALTRRAAKAGLTLSYTAINGLAAGTYKSRPAATTPAALVYLSDDTAEQVYAGGGLPVPLRPLAEDLPEDADSLAAEQRQAVLAVVRQFASVNRTLARYERSASNDEAPMNRAAASAANDDDQAPAPPTEADYGLAATRKPRERAHDDQSVDGEGL